MLILALSLLVGCGETEKITRKTTTGGTAAIESLKTIGDVMALEPDSEQTAMYNDYCIYVFELEGTNYRVISSMPADVSEAVWALDWADVDHDRKQKELISPLEIQKYENLDDSIPTQEELDAFIGKTGEDLFDDGWYNSGWDLEQMEFWMNKGPHCCKVVFEGYVDAADYETFEEEDIYPMIIKSIAYDGLGDATNIELDENGKMIE